MKYIIILALVSLSSGQEDDKETDRIVGGTVVNIVDYPYHASVQVTKMHYCSGVIIHPEWVLTAAHCVTILAALYFSVRLGSTRHDSGGDIHSVTRIVIHEHFEKATADYDIALIKLYKSITAKNAQAIQLPSPGTGPEDGKIITVTGWGAVHEGGPGSDVLRMATLPVVNNRDCNRDFDGVNFVTDRMFCANDRTGLNDSCRGDSGGPAVIEGVLYGIFSWSKDCANPNYPSVFVNVPVLMEWIDAVTCG